MLFATHPHVLMYVCRTEHMASDTTRAATAYVPFWACTTLASSWQVTAWARSMASAARVLFSAVALYHALSNKIKSTAVVDGVYRNKWDNLRSTFQAYRCLYNREVARIQIPSIGIDCRSARGKSVFFGTSDSKPIGAVVDVEERDAKTRALVQLEPCALPSSERTCAVDYLVHVVCNFPGSDDRLRIEHDDPSLCGLEGRVCAIVIRDNPRSPYTLPFPAWLSVTCCF